MDRTAVTRVWLVGYPRVACLAFCAVTMAAAAVTPVGAQPLPTERSLPTAVALEAASAALEACQKQGYRVSVAVVDRGGVSEVVLRGDGAGPHTPDTAVRKAYTAVTFRAPTTRMAQIANTNPEAAGLRQIDRVILLGGGLPMLAGNDLVGAIGVSGSPGAHLDDGCAQVGIDKIKDRLK